MLESDAAPNSGKVRVHVLKPAVEMLGTNRHDDINGGRTIILDVTTNTSTGDK